MCRFVYCLLQMRLPMPLISRNHFDHVLASLSTALVVTDRDGLIETVNKVACNMLCCREHELSGRPATEVLPESVSTLLNGKHGVHDVETEFEGTGGAVIPVLVSANPLSEEEGGWVITAIDITRRRNIEEQLRRSEERYREVIENVSEGILVVQDACCVFVNPALLSLTGYSSEDIVGHEFMPFVHPDDRPKVQDRYMRRVRGEPVEHKYDFRVICKSGDSVWVELSAVMIHWEGRPATLSFVSGITARKQAEESVLATLEKQKELNDLKSRFVSMTSHEFRTPLATILTSIELLRDYSDKLPPEERGELFNSTVTAVNRMTQLLDDVLVIGKAEANRLEFHPKPMALRKFCEKLAAEICVTNEKNNAVRHEVELRTEGDIETAMLDEKLLSHILGNLLSNAVKYSPEGGQILFSINGLPDKFEFIVADEGIGIPEAEQERLFETFFRARNVGSISGTGLGLSIVKYAIDLHDGEIRLESKKGKGTRFIVTLPRVEVMRG